MAAPRLDENGAAYMEQDEEWEREGLLDPAWEKQQRKVSQTCPNLIKLDQTWSNLSEIVQTCAKRSRDTIIKEELQSSGWHCEQQ